MMAGMPMCGMPAMAWPAATPMIPNPTPHPPLSATINAAIADILTRPKVRPAHLFHRHACKCRYMCLYLESLLTSGQQDVCGAGAKVHSRVYGS